MNWGMYMYTEDNENDELEKRHIKDENGVVMEATIYLSLKLKTSGKDYLIYSFNEQDKNGLKILRMAESEVQEDGKAILKKVSNENDLKELDSIITKALKQEKIYEEVSDNYE